MLACKPTDIPMDCTNKFGSRKESVPMENGRYVGKLISLSYTRPDICFSMSLVSQFMNNPTKEHMNAVYRILRYLKMTLGKRIYFQQSTKRNIEIHSDANWVGSIID